MGLPAVGPLQLGLQLLCGPSPWFGPLLESSFLFMTHTVPNHGIPPPQPLLGSFLGSFQVAVPGKGFNWPCWVHRRGCRACDPVGFPKTIYGGRAAPHSNTPYCLQISVPGMGMKTVFHFHTPL